ncbi:unnamed protein product, partial [Adineta steineri]
SAAYYLHSIGAVDFFNALRIDLTPELERRVDEILENILSQHFITEATSNISRTSSSMEFVFVFNFKNFILASCQLLKSNTQVESANSTMFQLPLFNLSQQQPLELSSRRYDTINSTSHSLSNQSNTRGILKITAPSVSDLLSTLG